VAGGTDGSIRLWSLETRMKLATLRNRLHLRTGHGALTTCLACSPDGALLASGHFDGAIYLWEIAGGLELDVRLAHEGPVGGLAFPPGGLALISAGADATLKFWDLRALRAGDARRELRRQPEAITCMALAQQGKMVVTGHVNRTLRAHDIATHRLVATFHGHRSPPAALAVSPAGDLVASGGRDGWVRVHALDTREQLGMHQEHGRGVADLLFLPGDRKVVSVAMDNVAVVWSLDDPELTRTLVGSADESFTSLALARDGRRLICATAEGRFRVWLIPA